MESNTLSLLPLSRRSQRRLTRLRTATSCGEQCLCSLPLMKLGRDIDKCPTRTSSTEELVFPLHTELCERSDVPSVEEGRHVGRVTADARDDVSNVEACAGDGRVGVVRGFSLRGQPTTECSFKVCPSTRRLVASWRYGASWPR